MAERPVDLDAERSSEERIAAEFRRASRLARGAARAVHPARDNEIRSALLEGPANSWAEVATKTRFLLGRFAQTSEGQDERVQKLIQRALSDCARLIKREERNDE